LEFDFTPWERLGARSGVRKQTRLDSGEALNCRSFQAFLFSLYEEEKKRRNWPPPTWKKKKY
jgi:hypothetical protein